MLSARNLPRMDAFGTCDPFCRIAFCGESRETSVCSLARPTRRTKRASVLALSASNASALSLADILNVISAGSFPSRLLDRNEKARQRACCGLCRGRLRWAGGTPACASHCRCCGGAGGRGRVL